MSLQGNHLPARIARLVLVGAVLWSSCILAVLTCGSGWLLECWMMVRSLEAGCGSGSSSQSMHGVTVACSPDRDIECRLRMLRKLKLLPPTPPASMLLCVVRRECGHEALCKLAATNEPGGPVFLRTVEDGGSPELWISVYAQWCASRSLS